MKSARKGIKTTIFSVIFMFLAAFFLVFAATANAAESGCIKCHTSENLLKTLHKPSKTVAEEGEG